MNEIKRYATIGQENGVELDRIINDKIPEGWQPFGNPYTYTRNGKLVFCQAMVSEQEFDNSTVLPPELENETKPGAGREKIENFYKEISKSK